MGRISGNGGFAFHRLLSHPFYFLPRYQGENNLFECACTPYSTAGQRDCTDAGYHSCGDALNGTGYACQTLNLIKQWRAVWSRTAGTTNAAFPFGIATLAAGTDEGFSYHMASFRWAQTANHGILPNKDMPNTFVAQGYDIGDPWSPGNWQDGGPSSRAWQADAAFQARFDDRDWYRDGGVQYGTNYFMGS